MNGDQIFVITIAVILWGLTVYVRSKSEEKTPSDDSTSDVPVQLRLVHDQVDSDMEDVLVKRRLIARAAEVSGVAYDRSFQVDIIDRIHDPQFQSHVQHDWRNYIDDEVKLIWNHLTESARLALFVNAEIQARKEEWD